MKPTIEYNVEFDFVLFTHTSANSKEEKNIVMEEPKQNSCSKNKNMDKSFDQFFKDLEQYYHHTLSYMQRNELDMFFKHISVFSDYLMSLALKAKKLEEQSLEDFRLYIIKSLEIDEEDLDFDLLLNALKSHYDNPRAYADYRKETEMILETLKDARMFNVVFKNAVASLRVLFIEEKYEPAKKAIELKLEEHNVLYKENPIAFLINISSGMLKEKDLIKSSFRTYLTYFIPFRIMLSVKHGNNQIIYSHELDQMKKEDIEKDFTQSLLKFLSDPKRYQMIQMLSQQKYYANELAKIFKITPATMSYHVSKLYTLGLITLEPGEKNKLYIKLDNERLVSLLSQITIELIG